MLLAALNTKKNPIVHELQKVQSCADSLFNNFKNFSGVIDEQVAKNNKEKLYNLFTDFVRETTKISFKKYLNPDLDEYVHTIRFNLDKSITRLDQVLGGDKNIMASNIALPLNEVLISLEHLIESVQQTDTS